MYVLVLSPPVSEDFKNTFLAEDCFSSLSFSVEDGAYHTDHSPEQDHTALQQHHHDIEDALTPAAAHEARNSPQVAAASCAKEKMPEEFSFGLMLSPAMEVEFNFRSAQDAADDDEAREDKTRKAEQMEMLAFLNTHNLLDTLETRCDAEHRFQQRSNPPSGDGNVLNGFTDHSQQTLPSFLPVPRTSPQGAFFSPDNALVQKNVR
jgi:hypothetical protein